jgi:hypothetical protein
MPIKGEGTGGKEAGSLRYEKVPKSGDFGYNVSLLRL